MRRSVVQCFVISERYYWYSPQLRTQGYRYVAIKVHAAVWRPYYLLDVMRWGVG